MMAKRKAKGGEVLLRYIGPADRIRDDRGTGLVWERDATHVVATEDAERLTASSTQLWAVEPAPGTEAPEASSEPVPVVPSAEGKEEGVEGPGTSSTHEDREVRADENKGVEPWPRPRMTS